MLDKLERFGYWMQNTGQSMQKTGNSFMAFGCMIVLLIIAIPIFATCVAAIRAW